MKDSAADLSVFPSGRSIREQANADEAAELAKESWRARIYPLGREHARSLKRYETQDEAKSVLTIAFDGEL